MPTPGPPERLDSWKAIADYLNRDIATVRRWEKTQSLPVRRVPGDRPGRSVFAYKADLDAWLETTPPAVPATPHVARQMWMGLGLTLLLASTISTLGWRYLADAAPGGALDVEVAGTGVIARDQQGTEVWRHDFPPEYLTLLPELRVPPYVIGGVDPAVYVMTSHQSHRATRELEGGTLHAFAADGQIAQSFSFADAVTVGDTSYGPPWAMTMFAVDDRAGSRRIAVAAHHYTWYPSLVTILDERWQRRGTFVHAGWVEVLRWLAPDRLLIGGFSEAQNGGMVAIVDPDALDGQGPAPPGTRYYCEGCGDGAPIRMVVMPRSEVNRISGSRFNRAVVDITAGRIVARTIEVPHTDSSSAADAVYEFTPSLELIDATFSNRYWDLHRLLEMEGKLDHTREECPDREGPRELLVWEPATGWRTITTG